MATQVPADLIAEAYRQRWLIKLFFRMIKQLLGCRHLLSTKSAGVKIQMYLANIACLLILTFNVMQNLDERPRSIQSSR